MRRMNTFRKCLRNFEDENFCLKLQKNGNIRKNYGNYAFNYTLFKYSISYDDYEDETSLFRFASF